MEKAREEKDAALRANKELIMKALTDPGFRNQLKRQPLKALGKRKLTVLQKKEIALVLATVRGIESQMSIIADELLCACGVIV